MSYKERSVLSRWIDILRMKASEYEHKARHNGENVVSPSMDDICNEMEAFKQGLEGGNK